MIVVRETGKEQLEIVSLLESWGQPSFQVPTDLVFDILSSSDPVALYRNYISDSNCTTAYISFFDAWIEDMEHKQFQIVATII